MNQIYKQHKKSKAVEKKILVYVLELDGVKAVHFDIDALCDALKYEFEDIIDNDAVEMEFKVYCKLMTDKEIEEMPEFDGF